MNERQNDNFIDSLERLTSQKQDFTLYCGHGENTALSAEKERNPYL